MFKLMGKKNIDTITLKSLFNWAYKLYLTHNDSSFYCQFQVSKSYSYNPNYSLHTIYLLTQEDVYWL